MSFVKLTEELDGQTFFIVSEDDCSETSFGYVVEPRGTYNRFFLFPTEEDAGKYVREHWADYVEDDPDEAIQILGAENLIRWGLGQEAGPGSVKVKSLKEWLDLHLDCWDEHFESVFEVDTVSEDLEELFGFKPTIAAIM